MTILIDFAYAIALVLALPFLTIRRFRRGKSTAPRRELFGNIPSRRVASRCIWIHGVSLGEINATRTIVREIQHRAPEIAIVISATTRTGLDQARNLYPELLVFRFPLDFSFVIRRVLSRIRPSLIVLMELEVWPNLLAIAQKRNIPVVIANGRVTEEKSMSRFDKPVIRTVARRMFGQLQWVGAQDDIYAQRFEMLGVPPAKISVTGSVKYDAADQSDRVEGQAELARELGLNLSHKLWVCGSTGPGEESLILSAYESLLSEFPDLQLAIVPRKPERFHEVAKLITDAGFPCLRRSTGKPQLPADNMRHLETPVYLGDTMGELRKFYGLADIVFVGRSLVPLGGSDVMEVAGLARAMVFGPYMENFAEVAEALTASDGCAPIASAADLKQTLCDLLRDDSRRVRMGLAARRVIAGRRGATDKTVTKLFELVDFHSL
ncbi:MAG: 3-deoxy-D-manno-octulosonic acid transferase [Phycisphaerae bacterium]